MIRQCVVPISHFLVTELLLSTREGILCYFIEVNQYHVTAETMSLLMIGFLLSCPTMACFAAPPLHASSSVRSRLCVQEDRKSRDYAIWKFSGTRPVSAIHARIPNANTATCGK